MYDIFIFFFFYLFLFFFFKQKTAYEIYQCDWSSDVCSSDLDDGNVARDISLQANTFYKIVGHGGQISMISASLAMISSSIV